MNSTKVNSSSIFENFDFWGLATWFSVDRWVFGRTMTGFVMHHNSDILFSHKDPLVFFCFEANAFYRSTFLPLASSNRPSTHHPQNPDPTNAIVPDAYVCLCALSSFTTTSPISNSHFFFFQILSEKLKISPDLKKRFEFRIEPVKLKTLHPNLKTQ